VNQESQGAFPAGWGKMGWEKTKKKKVKKKGEVLGPRGGRKGKLSGKTRRGEEKCAKH